MKQLKHFKLITGTAGPVPVITLSLLCKYVNSLFLLMRPGIHGGWPVLPCTHYKSTGSCGGSSSCPPCNYDELVTGWEIFSCLAALGGQNQRASDNTCRRIKAAPSCRAIIHLEMVMSALSAVFRRYSRASRALSIDLEYHAANHGGVAG